MLELVPPPTKVHNLIFGRTWIDSPGEMILTNLTTGDKVVLYFQPCGWFGYDTLPFHFLIFISVLIIQMLSSKQANLQIIYIEDPTILNEKGFVQLIFDVRPVFVLKYDVSTYLLYSITLFIFPFIINLMCVFSCLRQSWSLRSRWICLQF